MHVRTQSQISPENAWARIQSACLAAGASPSTRQLVREPESAPPKLALTGSPLTFNPSAEVAVNATHTGSEIVLRLMWGPLPAPFPRAMAALGLLTGMATAAWSDGSPAELAAAVLIVLLPVAAVFHQRQGEREIQSRLSNVFDGAQFESVPH